MFIDLFIFKYIAKDLESRKKVSIGGPRQVGKTTLAKKFLTSKTQYLNWDDLEGRATIKTQSIDPSLGTVCLDEVHKYCFGLRK